MFRKTDVISLRTHERVVSMLLGIIQQQNDRIMLLAGRPWTPPPAWDVPPDIPTLDLDGQAGLRIDAEQWEPEE